MNRFFAWILQLIEHPWVERGSELLEADMFVSKLEMAAACGGGRITLPSGREIIVSGWVAPEPLRVDVSTVPPAPLSGSRQDRIAKARSKLS